jgi:crotonobetaine/carnitine-CoA ligase
MVPVETLRAAPIEAKARTPQPLRPHSVQYTSGTTARPKGVVWTHANALWGASVTAAHLRLRPEDATPVYLPLFHTNALAYSTLPTLWSGGKVVLMPRFSASRFWDSILKHDCTWMSMTGFPLRALQDDGVPAHRLKLIGLGAAEHQLATRLGSRSIGWFGMTETVSQCTISNIELPGPLLSMGSPVPEYEVDIRRDDGTPTEDGEAGNLLILGTPGLSLFLEYLNDPKATEEAFDAEGWFRTGDLAEARNGELFFTSRAKDMLKVSGENVAAIEIETVILRVRGVRECAVVGRPDRMRDEVPVAFVVADQPGPELEAVILQTCERALSDFKRPRQIIFTDELPKGTLDKILKKDLRARLL